MKILKSLLYIFVITNFICCNDNIKDSDSRSIKRMEVSREVAYELIKKELTNLTLDSIDIYISKQPLPANSNIETVVGTINSPETVSWLFFVDEMPKQNWGHPCQYIFVDADINHKRKYVH